MKKTILTAIIAIVASIGFAQTDGLSYQAVIINNNAQEIPGFNVSGNYLSEGKVALQFTIYDQFDQIEFQEAHETVTDKYGMVNLVIGQGVMTGESPGQFDQIDWDGTPKELLVELGIEGSPLEAFTRQDLLFVPYAYHRDVYAAGDLTVEGPSVLNGTFTVANQSLSTLSGDLVVQGTSTFEGDAFFENITVADWSELQGTLNVGDSATFNSAVSELNESPTTLSGVVQVYGNTMLNRKLNVEGVSTFADSAHVYAPLHVHGENPAWLSGDVQVGGNTVLEGAVTANSTAAINGQVTITAGLSGGDGNYNAYPLRVQGSNQGVAIRVNSNIPNGSNNFITFFDGQNEPVGRIEGQTAAEVASSPAYIYETAMLAANVAIATSNVIGATTSSTVCAGIGACVTAPIPSLTVSSGANLVLAIANLTAYQAFAYTNLGVTYLSGSADYAEWLKRANPSERMVYGDIVSVRGGEISKNSEFGSQMMVISVNPAVLGNMPADSEKHLYEKVAFMGQVPVKVRGKVKIGDYILPSGDSDGFGIAVEPQDMEMDDFSNIVGIAWSASDDALSNYVNVAIGMNRNDMVHVLKTQQSEMAAMRNELDELHRNLGELIPGYTESRRATSAAATAQSSTPQAQVSAEPRYVPTAEEMHLPLERSAFESGLELVKSQLRDQGIDVATHPVYKDIFNDEAKLNSIIDQAMQLATEQRERAVAMDKANGFR